MLSILKMEWIIFFVYKNDACFICKHQGTLYACCIPLWSVFCRRKITNSSRCESALRIIFLLLAIYEMIYFVSTVERISLCVYSVWLNLWPQVLRTMKILCSDAFSIIWTMLTWLWVNIYILLLSALSRIWWWSLRNSVDTQKIIHFDSVSLSKIKDFRMASNKNPLPYVIICQANIFFVGRYLVQIGAGMKTVLQKLKSSFDLFTNVSLFRIMRGGATKNNIYK